MKTYTNTLKFIADIHYCEKNLPYLKKPMENLLSDMKKEKPIITVIGGDYFHKRLAAEEEAYKTAIDNIVEMSKHTKHLIFLRGTWSHDYDTLEILNTLKKLQPNILYFDTKTEYQLEGYNILLIPEEYPTNPEEYYSDIYDKNYDFIFGHGDIQGAMLHSGINNAMLKNFKFNIEKLSKAAEFVFFGHIHKHQFLRHNVTYPGSLGRWKQNEEEDKGYLALDLNTKILNFRKVEAYKFKTIEIKTEADLEKYKEIIENPEIKIAVRLSKEMEEIKESLRLHKNITVNSLKEEKEDITNEVMFEDIEKLDISRQYEVILNADKQISKKKRELFLNPETFDKYVTEIISDIRNDNQN